MRLSVRDLAFGYAGHPNLFDNWAADFQRGATTAITGRSGCGKSTLLYILGLMLSPRSGQIYLDDQPVHELSDRQRSVLRAHHYGFVFQDAALDVSRTVLDNVIEPALYRGEDLHQARIKGQNLLDKFGVEHRGTHKPGEISGGQAQRIALCRALLGNPEIILADEPTGNLDPQTEETVITELEHYAHQGATVIIVTHSMEIAERCADHMVLA